MKYIRKYEQNKTKPIINYYSNGQKKSEHYIINGKLHREDGPAIQYWYENGQKKSEQYYINSKYYSREDWIEKLKEINSPHYEEQLLKYNSKKYNL
jgi:antitoxin component YwqK of YwqJK toxin-antitoxin module